MVTSAVAAGAAILTARHPAAELRGGQWIALYLALTWLTVFARGGLRSRLHASVLDHLSELLIGTTIAAAFTIAVRVLAEPVPQAASTIRLWAFTGVCLLGGRFALNVIRHRAGRKGVSTLVVGAGLVGQRLARHLLERPEIGLRPVGFLDENPLPGTSRTLPVVGPTWELRSVVDRYSIEHVIVTFSTAAHPAMLSLLRECHDVGVDVSMVPRYFESVNRNFELDHVGGTPLLHIRHVDPRGWQFAIKSALDRAFAAVILIALSPLMLGIALLVYLTSGRPVFFRQTRIGRDANEFDLLKFRTMRPSADGIEADAVWAAHALGLPPPPLPSVDRRTPLGDILRRACLDELPQLINILRGEMSLIGPRPERPGYVRAFEQQVYRYGDRHRVKSGLTGWAQVQRLRGECSLEDRVEWDNYYVENWTPWLDLKILLLTIPAVIKGGGPSHRRESPTEHPLTDTHPEPDPNLANARHPHLANANRSSPIIAAAHAAPELVGGSRAEHASEL